MTTTFDNPADPATTSPGTELELRVDAVAYGGKGVARFGGPPGKVFFVKDAIPGDLVKARVTEDNGRYGEAEVIELLTRSDARGPSPCNYSEECGGCQWMGVAYAKQLEWKRTFVESALKRIGKLAKPVTVTMIGSESVLEYRNRILVRAHLDGHGHLTFGYFARQSRRLVPIHACAIADPAINRVLTAIQAMPLGDLPALKIRIEVQRVPGETADAAPGVVITIYPAEGPRAAMDTIVARVKSLPHVTWAGLVFALNDAPSVVLEHDLGLSFRTQPGQFQQVNMPLNRTLRRLVKDQADKIAPKRILDVFCGSGNLSLPLATTGRYVEGIEANKKAIAIAKENAAANGIDGVRYLAGDAEKHMWKCHRAGESFDLVILDPPRQGMYQGMIPLKNIGPQHIIYVSCDPTTLARDLGYLTRDDTYVIEDVTALDFFPNTYHVETVVVLRRQP